MSSAILAATEYIHQPSTLDADIEMSDRESTTRDRHNIGLVEIQIKNTHQLFQQMESDAYTRRAGVVKSFLSLMEVSPAKAMFLINEASQESDSQQFKDFVLFRQLHSDLTRLRESRDAVHKSNRTSSSSQQSIFGPTLQLDTLQWMFAFFNMYAVPIHPKSLEENDTTLYVREPQYNRVCIVVLAQQNADTIPTILDELSASSKTRLGLIVTGNQLSVLVIDQDSAVQEPNPAKNMRTVSIAQKSFDLTNTSDFANLIAFLEGYLAQELDIETVVKQLGTKEDETNDMESSPVPKVFKPFDEKDTFYLDEKFYTSLSNLQFAKSYGFVPSQNYCVKKRSYFCDWEREILTRLKNHPYIIREIEVGDANVDFTTTMFVEPVRPLNKKLFSLVLTDNQGNSVGMTQQILNTRFELLRQFIKQALHSIVYCHTNGIVHNNILSRGATFLLDEQYRLKLMGFDHAIVSNDKQLLFRDMRHLAIVFAELMFNVQFDVQGDDELTDWSAVWEEMQALIEQYDDIVEECPHTTPNDKMLYTVNQKTKKHMFNLLEQMFHTARCDYYHIFMYHSFVGMASSAYKEKSKQRLREKTVQTLNQNKSAFCKKREEIDHSVIAERWANRRVSSK